MFDRFRDRPDDRLFFVIVVTDQNDISACCDELNRGLLDAVIFRNGPHRHIIRNNNTFIAELFPEQIMNDRFGKRRRVIGIQLRQQQMGNHDHIRAVLNRILKRNQFKLL
ncbi:hypothetical protein D3C73_1307070 [compost metagenome]